jgi:membrane-associated phospholipid phosphatase
VTALDAALERRPKWLLALVATVVHGVLYLLPNHFQIVQVRLLPLTAVDRAVPFWPLTAWIYWSDYALVFVAFQWCRVPGATARFVYALSAVILAGTTIHWLCPTAYPRQLYPLEPGAAESITGFLFAHFRAADTAASCMPSLHVAASYLAAFALLGEDRRRATWLLVWATAIFASTLTTKQHYLVDGLAGIALAAAALMLGNRLVQGTRHAAPWARA